MARPKRTANGDRTLASLLQALAMARRTSAARHLQRGRELLKAAKQAEREAAQELGVKIKRRRRRRKVVVRRRKRGRPAKK